MDKNTNSLKWYLYIVLVLLGLSHLMPQWAYPMNAYFIGFVFAIFCVNILIFFKKEYNLSPNITPSILYFIFLLIITISTLISDYPPEGYYKLSTFIQGFALLLLITSYGNIANNKNEAENQIEVCNNAVSYYFIITALLLAIYGIYQYFVGYEESLKYLNSTLLNKSANELDDITVNLIRALENKRVTSTFGNPNILCAFFALSMPFCLSQLFLQKKKIIKAFLSLVISLILLVSYLTASRAGLLTLILAIFLSLFFVGIKKVKEQKTDMAIVVILLLIFSLTFNFYSKQSSTAKDDANKIDLMKRMKTTSTLYERIYYVKTGLKIFQHYPIIGTGLGGYALNYGKYKELKARESQHAHNFIIELLSETGLIGTLLFFIFLSHFFYTAMKVFPKGDKEAIIFYFPFILSPILFLINSLAEITFYYRELFLDFVLCISVIYIIAYKGEAKLNYKNYVILSFAIIIGLMTIKYNNIPSKAKPRATYGDDYIDSYYSEKDSSYIEKAYEEYKSAVKLQPKNAQYNATMSYVLNLMNDRESALLYMEKAVRLNPHSASQHSQLSMMYFERGRIQDAINEQFKAIENYPLKGEYHFKLGCVYFQDNKKELAKKEVQTAIDLEPDNKKYKEYFLKYF